MDNMELWNQVCVTPVEITKKVTFGARKYTSICSQYQIKNATKLWGPFGSNWGVKDEEFLTISSNTILYKAILYYQDNALPIHSDCELIVATKKGDRYNEDWSKKLATDALTKGLSKLGFNSDVFEGKHDGNKYADRPEGASNRRTINRWMLESEYNAIATLKDVGRIKKGLEYWQSDDRGLKKEYRANIENIIAQLS